MCLGEVCAVSPTRSRFPDYGPDLDFLPNIGPEKVCFFSPKVWICQIWGCSQKVQLCVPDLGTQS